MRTALVVIDVQVDLFAYPESPIYRGERVLERIAALISRAREAGAPVVYVQHAESDGSPMARGKPGFAVHPAIAPLAGDAVVVKKTPSAFHRTALKRVLAELACDRLVLCGLQTEYCVDTTVRHGSVLGYEQIVAQDAHSTYDSQPLRASEIILHHQRIWRGRFAEVVPADKIEFL